MTLNKKALTAPSINSNTVPFSSEDIEKYYKLVLTYNNGARLINTTTDKAKKMVAGQPCKCVPILAGHVVFRSIITAQIPISEILTPILPSPDSPLSRSAYGIYTFEDTVKYKPYIVSFIDFKGHLYWLEYQDGERTPGSAHFFWVLVNKGNVKGM